MVSILTSLRVCKLSKDYFPDFSNLSKYSDFHFKKVLQKCYNPQAPAIPVSV